MAEQILNVPLMIYHATARKTSPTRIRFAIAVTTIIAAVLVLVHNYDGLLGSWEGVKRERRTEEEGVVESEHGAVAADDGRCSDVGVSVLRNGGHAVDAAVATALCLGVVHPMSSGIGGGGFMVVRSSATSKAEAYDMRETAPLAASQNMYEKNPQNKSKGALSIGVPGEIAGLHAAWLKYGQLPWKNLVQPAIRLSRDGFLVTPYIARAVKISENAIMADPGLRQVFAPNGRLLEAGDTCYNLELACTLDVVAEQGPQAFYNGSIGESLVRDVQEAGGILTMEDLQSYRVEVSDAMIVESMGYTILGMPPPSSGTVGLSLVLNILDSYGTSDAAKGSLGLHRLIESLKHMFAMRMNLGDPKYVNITEVVSDMLSSSYAKKLQQKIVDNTTFPAGYYLYKWSQLNDHGTSHFCIVDADRNAISMTTTVNNYFGAGVLSPSTGIVLNNEMDDFSIPTDVSPDKLPPAPSNFIQPSKRPLSSMTPIIILKGNQLAGVVGGSGGLFIIPAVIQVFLNNFILGMKPLASVQHPRVYHKLIPNIVLYENWTVIDGEHIELSQENKLFLTQRGHLLKAQSTGAICQLVVHNLQNPLPIKGKYQHGLNNEVFHGMLTAVSDPRKDGMPAGE